MRSIRCVAARRRVKTIVIPARLQLVAFPIRRFAFAAAAPALASQLELCATHERNSRLCPCRRVAQSQCRATLVPPDRVAQLDSSDVAVVESQPHQSRRKIASQSRDSATRATPPCSHSAADKTSDPLHVCVEAMKLQNFYPPTIPAQFSARNVHMAMLSIECRTTCVAKLCSLERLNMSNGSTTNDESRRQNRSCCARGLRLQLRLVPLSRFDCIAACITPLHACTCRSQQQVF